jgi:hypothetical protein
MTRQDYVLVAGIIASVEMPSRTRHELVQSLTDGLSRSNPRFDADRFREAAWRGVVGLRGAASITTAYLLRQRAWSREAFGPGRRTKGVIEHIRKELAEIEREPLDLGEWVDVVILAFDGALRAGHEPSSIIEAIRDKQAVNERRQWPDWRTMSEDEAIEHRREVS